MDNLSQKISVELENIDEILKGIPPYSKLPFLSPLELAGTAALLHNFYNAIENILKQIFISNKISIPEGKSWHKDLIETAVKEAVITENCKYQLSNYLAFRHFFSHAYALDLYSEKIEPLVKNMKDVFTIFRDEISKYL
jgi:uncharacterized protein YutE (UPF0331/DUF86 family)